MGTRGLIGFTGRHSDCPDVGVYVHCDADPEHTGIEFFRLCKELLPKDASDFAMYLADLPHSEEAYDSSQPIELARALLQEKATEYHETHAFLKNELFCKFAYLLDIDSGTFRFYRAGKEMGSVSVDESEEAALKLFAIGK